MNTKICSKCKKEKDLSEFHKDNSRKNGIRYACKICYKEIKVEYYLLHREEKKENSKIRQQSLSGKYSQYKAGAKSRNLEFNLTFEEFESFWQKDCFYCGHSIPTIGIDRIDSNQNYTIENCRPCCVICNQMKLNYTEEEWYSQMLDILKHQGII